MKNLKSILFLLLISFSFGCSKEKNESVEEERKSTTITINSEGAISEFKILNRETKKLIIHASKPKPTNVRPGNGYNYATYKQTVELSNGERLTIQVPITKDLKSFSIDVVGGYYPNLREDKNLNVYYIDFEGPSH